MLLDNNTEKVIDLLDMYDKLSNIDKIRLAIYLLENKNFDINFNIKDMIILLTVLIILRSESKGYSFILSLVQLKFIFSKYL